MKTIALILFFASLTVSAEERVQNPCFSYGSEYSKQACEICQEYASKLAETECREESDFADEIFSDVIYADSDEYATVYKEWRTRVNARDRCKVSLLLQCLEN